MCKNNYTQRHRAKVSASLLLYSVHTTEYWYPRYRITPTSVPIITIINVLGIYSYPYIITYDNKTKWLDCQNSTC